MSTELVSDVLHALDALSGGVHPGNRPVHAKGVMLTGTFAPAPAAATLTRAPHASRPSTPVTARFSIASGVPTAPENVPAGAGPQGLAIRFQLGDHVHTDIIAHSQNGFPARTADEFLEFVRAAAASGPGGPTPPPIVAFLAAHPAARAYVEAPKPLPESYARQAYFAVTAFTFVAPDGTRRVGRFRLRPAAGTAYLSPEQAATQPADFLTAELTRRVAAGPVVFQVVVQLADPGDVVTDATAVWPDTRPEVEFGTVTLTARADDTAPELRKVIFDPLPRLDGIETAGDPLTGVRADIYLLSGRRRRQAAAG